MTDPHRPDDSHAPWRNPQGGEQSTLGYPPYPDPAYAGQVPLYTSGYPSQPLTGEPSQQQWGASRPPGQPPAGGSGSDGDDGPPEPPRSPGWLWFVASAAVLLVVGLVIALVISNDSAQRSATVAPMPSLSPVPPAPSTGVPRPTTTPPPTSTPTTTPSTPATSTPSTTPSTTPPSPTSTVAGVPQSVGYSVTGSGRALSIAYIGTGGVLSTEFNVVLPWNKQVTLTPQESKIASVTVVNFGEQVSCSVTVAGTQLSQHTGSLLTICAASG